MQPTLNLVNQKKWFTKKELGQVFITIFVLAIIASFGKWGDGERVLIDGFPNFLQALHLLFVIVFFNILVKKWYGKKLGYLVSYEYSPVMLGIGFFIAFLSGGLWPFLIMGYTTYKVVPRLRFNIKQGGYRNSDISKIIVSGLVFNCILAFVGKTLLLATGSLYFNDIITLSIFVSLFSLIPFELLMIWKVRFSDKLKITPSDGTCLFYYSRPLYVYIFVFLVFYAALIYASGLWSVILSLLIALCCYYIFRKYIEIDSHKF